MSEIRFFCPHCNQHMRTPEGSGGQVVNCTKCSAPLKIPQPLAAHKSVPRSAQPNSHFLAAVCGVSLFFLAFTLLFAFTVWPTSRLRAALETAKPALSEALPQSTPPPAQAQPAVEKPAAAPNKDEPVTPAAPTLADEAKRTNQPMPLISQECWFSGEADSSEGHLEAQEGNIFIWIRCVTDKTRMREGITYSTDTGKCALLLPDGTRLSPVAMTLSMDAANMKPGDGWAWAYRLPTEKVTQIGDFRLQLLDDKPIPVSPVLQPFELRNGRDLKWRWPAALIQSQVSFNENGSGCKMKITPKSAGTWHLMMTGTNDSLLKITILMSGSRPKEVWENQPYEIRDSSGHLLYAGTLDAHQQTHSPLTRDHAKSTRRKPPITRDAE